MKNDYNNLNDDVKNIEMPKLKITDLNFDSLPEMNEKLIEVDYLAQSSEGGLCNTVLKHIRNSNPKEWIFLAFFCTILTRKIK